VQKKNITAMYKKKQKTHDTIKQAHHFFQSSSRNFYFILFFFSTRSKGQKEKKSIERVWEGKKKCNASPMWSFSW